MGALTAKKTAFTYRVWEQRSFTELDNSEVALFKVRVEKLKNKRVRTLPIRYWISDLQRFMVQPELLRNIFIYLLDESYYTYSTSFLNYVKKVGYVLAGFKAYQLILQKIASRKYTLSFFVAKKLSYKNFLAVNSFEIPTQIYSNVFVNDINQRFQHKKAGGQYNAAFLTELQGIQQIVLLANPRLDSPAFHACLYQMSQGIDFISFGSFANLFGKTEIPNSVSNVLNHIKSISDYSSTLVVINAFTEYSFLKELSVKVLSLKPFYMQARLCVKNLEYNDKAQMHLDLSQLPKKANSLYLSSVPGQSNIFMPINKNMFDHFLTRIINNKFISRLSLLYQLVIPNKIFGFVSSLGGAVTLGSNRFVVNGVSSYIG
jgi:hypothetical protein